MGLVRGERGGRRGARVDRLRVPGAGAPLLKSLGSLCGKQGAGTCLLGWKGCPSTRDSSKKAETSDFLPVSGKEIIHSLTWLMQEESFQE